MKNAIDQLYTLFSTDLSAKFTTFYKGEVAIVPQSYLPALMVFGNQTTVVAKSTAKDQYVYDITARAVIDLKLYLKESGTNDIISAQMAMYNFMEERNADGSLKSDTVLGVLRGNIRTDDFIFNNDVTITYSVIQTGEFFYYKADCNFTATTDLLLRP